MPVITTTALLLVGSNVFMTFAWYAHLKNLNDQKWYIAALASWGIALFEYLLQVPANRIGYTQLTISQLKIMQEVITLSVFAPFAVLYMQQPLKLDYIMGGVVLARGGVLYFSFVTPLEEWITLPGFLNTSQRRWRPCSLCRRR
jgi:uncharacterized protein (DUF486 family)